MNSPIFWELCLHAPMRLHGVVLNYAQGPLYLLNNNENNKTRISEKN
jgi:hypothetical protein